MYSAKYNQRKFGLLNGTVNWLNGYDLKKMERPRQLHIIDGYRSYHFSFIALRGHDPGLQETSSTNRKMHTMSDNCSGILRLKKKEMYLCMMTHGYGMVTSTENKIGELCSNLS